MALEKLLTDIPVTLNAGASAIFSHDLKNEIGHGLVPNFVVPNDASAIGVTAVTNTTITFTNHGLLAETAVLFHVEHRHTIIEGDVPDFLWQGLGPNVPASGGAANEAMFYGLTAGTGNSGSTDYAATVAVNAPVPFPRLGPATAGTGIIPGGTNQFVLPITGIYEVSWAIDFLEASQLLVKLGAVEQPHTCTMSGAGTQQNCNRVLVSATGGDLLSICNASGNAAALTVQTADGNRTHAQAPSLVIRRVS